MAARKNPAMTTVSSSPALNGEAATNSLLPAPRREQLTAADVVAAATEQTSGEMSGRLQEMLAILRQSLLAEFDRVKADLTNAALLSLAQRLEALNQQVLKPHPILLPALRRRAAQLEGQLAEIYRQAGTAEAEQRAADTVQGLLPNLTLIQHLPG
jgi:hypothetical protein